MVFFSVNYDRSHCSLITGIHTGTLVRGSYDTSFSILLQNCADGWQRICCAAYCPQPACDNLPPMSGPCRRSATDSLRRRRSAVDGSPMTARCAVTGRQRPPLPLMAAPFDLGSGGGAALCRLTGPPRGRPAASVTAASSSDDAPAGESEMPLPLPALLLLLLLLHLP